MKSLQSVVAGQRRAARRTAKPATAPEPPIEENSIRWRVQTAFANASPLMGVPLRVHQLVAYLLTKWSYEQDWEPGATPLTWPSNSVIMSGLGITLATLKRTNRAGEELGLFTLSGDSQGRRRGCRSPAGHIRFAYGYDLSPLRTRYREMLTITARNIELTRELTDLLTRLRTTRRRALSTLTRLPTEPDLITHTKALELDARLAALGASATRARDRREHTELAFLLAGTERALAEAEALAQRANTEPEDTHNPSKMSPTGSTSEPHSLNRINDPLITLRSGERLTATEAQGAGPSPDTAAHPRLQQVTPLRPDARTPDRPNFPTAAKFLAAAPALAAAVIVARPSWDELADACRSTLCPRLGIGKTLWHDTVSQLGRARAVTIVAHLASRPPGHFTKGPGAYLAALLDRDRRKRLNHAAFNLPPRQIASPANDPRPASPGHPLTRT